MVSNYHYILVIPKMCILCFTCHLYIFFRHSKSLDSSALKHSGTSFERFVKIIQLLRNFLKATITASFSDFASYWGHWSTGGHSPCAAKTVSHMVLPLSPSSPKVSVPPGKPNKFLKINKEVFRLLIPPYYTKILRSPNGHYLSFVEAESMQLLF